MNNLLAIFTSPSEVFKQQKEDSSWVAPALIVLAVLLTSNLVVVLSMDLEANAKMAQEATIQMLADQGLPEEQLANIPSQPPQAVTTVLSVSLISVAILFFVKLLFVALYFYIVGRIVSKEGDQQLGYGDWFAFASWVQMPVIIGSGLMLLAAIFMSSQGDPTVYNILALSKYISLPNADGLVLGQIVKALDLITFYTIGLMAVGFSVWTGRGIGPSVAISAAPYVVIYAIAMLL